MGRGKLDPDSSVTWDITDPFNPVPVDPGFWDRAWPWNNHSDQCEWPGGAILASDASTLYFPRYSVVQMIGFSGCDSTVLGDAFETGDTAAWSATVP